MPLFRSEHKTVAHLLHMQRGPLMSHFRLFQCASGSLITLALIAGCASGTSGGSGGGGGSTGGAPQINVAISPLNPVAMLGGAAQTDRKSTRLNSSHLGISYAV